LAGVGIFKPNTRNRASRLTALPANNLKRLVKKTQPLILVVVGFIALMNVARNPRFEAFHTVDVLGLIASGLCFGAALALIFRILRMGQFKWGRLTKRNIKHAKAGLVLARMRFDEQWFPGAARNSLLR
jgi:hypothetical protein